MGTQVWRRYNKFNFSFQYGNPSDAEKEIKILHTPNVETFQNLPIKCL